MPKATDKVPTGALARYHAVVIPLPISFSEFKQWSYVPPDDSVRAIWRDVENRSAKLVIFAIS